MYQPKISLKNLHLASAQDVFDQVAVHLLKQGEKSMRDGTYTCAYRGEQSRMCAAGCLIADDEYNPGVEESTWCELVEHKCVPDNHADLVRSLQRIHDGRYVQNWKKSLMELADSYALSISAIENL